MKKTAIAALIAASFGASAVNAAAISSFTFADVDGDGVAGDFNFLTPPVIGGTNVFNPIDAAGSLVPNSAARTIDEFTTGFQYSFYGQFHPYTFGAGLVGDITGTQDGDASNDTLTMSSVNWGGSFSPGPDDSQGFVDFDLAPDAGSLTATVLADNNDGTYDVSLEWNHVITEAGDFLNQNAFWYTEFTVGTSAVPVPAAVWLFGSGLVGLAGVARRRRQS